MQQSMGKAIRLILPGAKPGAKETLVEFDSAEELVHFLGVAGFVLPKDRAKTAPLGTTKDRNEGLFLVLHELSKNREGLPSDQLAEIAEVEGGRGLAGIARVWAESLRSLGLEMGDVVRRYRRGKVYYWAAGPKLGKAIAEMERARLDGRM